MDILIDIFTYVLSFVLIGSLLYLLWIIVRYSIITPILTRGSRTRLRKPNIEGIEKVIGFPVSDEIIKFYKEWPYLEKTEYYLIDDNNNKEWFIGGFEPISKIDVKEHIKTSYVKGLPIADDLNMGLYYLASDGSINISSPNYEGNYAKVADSIKEFSNFRVAEHEELYGDEDDA